jgi:uncharacterized protein YndB with AHSA1/START domain
MTFTTTHRRVQRLSLTLGLPALVAAVTMGGAATTGSTGSATEDDDVITPIRVNGTVAAPVDDVWHAWTTDDGARTWLSENTNIELRLGGPFEILFVMENPEGKRGSEGCTILSYLPREMLSFTWNAPPQFEHARDRHTWVVVQFEPVGADRTHVTLTHLGWQENITRWPGHEEEWNGVREYFVNAWPRVLEALERRFADDS